MIKIASRLELLRKQLGYNKTKMAELMNKPASTYGRYENGKNDIPFADIATLCRNVDVSVLWFTSSVEELENFRDDGSALGAVKAINWPHLDRRPFQESGFEKEANELKDLYIKSQKRVSQLEIELSNLSLGDEKTILMQKLVELSELLREIRSLL